MHSVDGPEHGENETRISVTRRRWSSDAVFAPSPFDAYRPFCRPYCAAVAAVLCGTRYALSAAVGIDKRCARRGWSGRHAVRTYMQWDHRARSNNSTEQPDVSVETVRAFDLQTLTSPYDGLTAWRLIVRAELLIANKASEILRSISGGIALFCRLDGSFA